MTPQPAGCARGSGERDGASAVPGTGCYGAAAGVLGKKTSKKIAPFSLGRKKRHKTRVKRNLSEALCAI